MSITDFVILRVIISKETTFLPINPLIFLKLQINQRSVLTLLVFTCNKNLLARTHFHTVYIVGYYNKKHCLCNDSNAKGSCENLPDAMLYVSNTKLGGPTKDKRQLTLRKTTSDIFEEVLVHSYNSI